MVTRFDGFFHPLSCTLPDIQSRSLLAQAYGYCLTADCSYQVGLIFWGPGGNGKGVITDVLMELVGRGNCAALHLADFKERFRLAELQNKLVNFSTEVDAKGLVSDSKIKAIISGDPVTAERKNQQPFVFRPFVKIIISCNNLPATSDKSQGYFRRWRSFLLLRNSVTSSVTVTGVAPSESLKLSFREF